MNLQSEPLKPPRSLPDWQLPAGVARGTWDYLQSPSIASDYDEFHAGHPLLALDQQLIERHLPQAASEGCVVDLGCGTGRNLLRLASLGWSVLGVDLSQAMLEEVQRKCQNAPFRDRVQTLHANMVELQSIPSQSAEAVLCMYSSFGMVRGRAHRRQVLEHVVRILKPQGKFLVHVHNRGSWLRDPRGIRLTMHGWLRSLYTSWELGDRIYPYRGLPNMFLHVFSHRELKRDLRHAGLAIEQFYVLNRESSSLLPKPWYATHVRAGGFLAVSMKPR
jgi:ubiquinone/menaquinone biosynthesis C-methylase UbiE